MFSCTLCDPLRPLCLCGEKILTLSRTNLVVKILTLVLDEGEADGEAGAAGRAVLHFHVPVMQLCDSFGNRKAKADSGSGSLGKR